MTYSAAWDIESSFDLEFPDQCDVRKPTVNAVMPDIYATAKVAKKPRPKAAGQSLPNIDKSVGFNPYDTGVLQRKKS